MTDQHFKEYVHTVSRTLNMSLHDLAKRLRLQERRLYTYHMPIRHKRDICRRLHGMVIRRVKREVS